MRARKALSRWRRPSPLENSMAVALEREEKPRSFSPCCLSAERSRARFFAQFSLSGQSEILRRAQDDSEGLRMTAWPRPPFPNSRRTTWRNWRVGSPSFMLRLERRCLRPASHASLGIVRAVPRGGPRRTRSQRVAALAAEATCSLMASANASGAEAPF